MKQFSLKKQFNLKKLCIATASGMLLASTHSFSDDKIEWTVTTVWPESLELIEIDKAWVDRVNRITGDDLEITFFSGGTLMPSTEVFDAVETGAIDAAGDWGGYWAGLDSAFSPLSTHTSLFNAADYLNWIFEWGGLELYQEVYGEYGIYYLPFGLVTSESGFRGRTQIDSLADLEGKRIRLAGRDQGRVLEKLGGSQVTLSGSEIYQAVERGVVDAAEFSMPGVDFNAGFAEVAPYWATPGWHQTGGVHGIMINKDAWDALPEQVQERLKVAAEANMAWSLAWAERKNSEGVAAFVDAGVEITRFSEEDLARIQEVTNEMILESACENPMHAKVYHSQISYLQEHQQWNEVSAPFNLSRNITDLPSLEDIEACM
ncbi:TRAP transporter substrate-binding protein DctP [Halomonas sp. PAMB 3232]|uniref:TRAP transporter substrate-binding protein DctP n=1 Tax=Halomonas sp. PAMB 3232 TaxID=3075221 RepID=UPI0028980CD2|nr:TRAP transporter substrate-binding protein DctP [Halomonas sp. PAMB 3232]WNL38282.1 TRAP transporter substrate-binding protein DctP [Halomonas sp. PAMB 3232]